MTDKQPEALRLADALEAGNCSLRTVMNPSAAELRRLHKANQKMMSLCQQLKKRPSDYLCAEDWEALEAVTS